MEGADTVAGARDDVRTDMVLALGMAVLAAFGTWVELTYSRLPVPPAAGGYALAIAAGAVLAFRRRAPVRVALAALVLVYAYHLLGYPGEAPGVVLFVAFYSVTAHGSGLRAIATGLGLTVAAEFVSVIPPHAVPWYSPAVLAPSVSIGAGVLIGAVVRQRRMALEARTVQEALAAEGRLRERMAAERLLIARDLHDILAHTLSVIAVQAGVALDALDDDPAQARKSITAVRTAARDVLPGLHETLRTLRGELDDGGASASAAGGESSGADGAGTRAPQPGLAQLPEVADRARASGLDVRLELPPGSAELSPFLELTAYWIVTEALSNVMKHSNASQVSAAVTVDGGQLLIRVEDNGRARTSPAPGLPAAAGGQGGFGLIGMRERAQLAGGTVQTGTTPAGGFTVSARLPLGAP